jgi:hypothetical protein
MDVSDAEGEIDQEPPFKKPRRESDRPASSPSFAHSTSTPIADIIRRFELSLSQSTTEQRHNSECTNIQYDNDQQLSNSACPTDDSDPSEVQMTDVDGEDSGLSEGPQVQDSAIAQSSSVRDAVTDDERSDSAVFGRQSDTNNADDRISAYSMAGQYMNDDGGAT